MLMPVPSPTSAERNRILSVHTIRVKALDRLYARREVVDDLIRSLESYLECQQSTGSLSMFSAERKCS